MSSKPKSSDNFDSSDNDSAFVYKESTAQKLSGKKFRKWTEEENFIYASFLRDNFCEFTSGHKRRSMNFFKKMSEAIQHERTNEHCRSHHQKMMKRFKSVKEIIRKFGSQKGVEKEATSQTMDGSNTNNWKQAIAFEGGDLLERERSFSIQKVELKMILMEEADPKHHSLFESYFEEDRHFFPF